MFTLPTIPLLVFTDLDATLLDHDDYSFDAALPALRRLAEASIPLIPNTSKTLAEVAELNDHRLHNSHPCIIENGGALCLPADYLPDIAASELSDGYRLHSLSRPYSSILEILDGLRQHHGFRFQGFNDMSVADIARHTGLHTADAAKAKQRLCSEPLLWQDSAQALQGFSTALAEHGLRLTRGGRFLHVTDDTDKARAMSALQQLYRQAGLADICTVALGDSANDIAMLQNADIAVIVRRKDGSRLDCHGRRQTILTTEPGPAGWNTAIEQILNDFTANAPTPIHGRAQCSVQPED